MGAGSTRGNRITAARRKSVAGLHCDVLMHLPVAVCVVDQDCKVVFANSALERMLGMPPAQGCDECVHAKAPSRSCCETELEAVMNRAGATVTVNGRTYEVSCAQVPVPDGGQYEIKTFHDVTDREQAAASVREERDRFLQIADHSREILWEVDATGMFTYVSQMAGDILGYLPDDLVGKMHFYDMWSEDTSEERKAAVLETFAARESFYDLSFNPLAKDGRTVHLSIYGTPVLDADGGLRGYRGTCVDTTDLKTVRHANSKLQEELYHSQKMEAVGRLAGGIAHDFRNILQVIAGNGELAAMAVGESEPVYEMVEEILKASSRASDLVRKLLTFSRCEECVMEHLDLNSVTSELLKLIRRVIGEHIIVKFTPAPAQPVLLADRTMLEQILMNLCINARDAMGSSGVLDIETEMVEFDEAFCRENAWAVPGSYVKLTVSDTGCGMDEETQDRIFEPFYTTKSAESGTGLGLATVYGIVRQHRGAIHVASEPGRGTRFKVHLPSASGVVIGKAAESGLAPKGGNETILLAEDDEYVRVASAKSLRRAGYTVIEACDGEQAVRAFVACQGKIDLLLTDLVMPRCGGREVSERIRSVAPDISVLFMSGYSDETMHDDFLLAEKCVLLQKPYGTKELLKEVRSVLDAGGRSRPVSQMTHYRSVC